ncbi:dienelactone hydrolase family protein [Aminipila sp.]|uniref:dienelactone hydrolase family protein n=1 Tax=Aminipila sp. TaxID=2060095 RepID=UPI00289E25AC|nr:alpha/beta hydrolase [Aminipila sp.]
MKKRIGIAIIIGLLFILSSFIYMEGTPDSFNQKVTEVTSTNTYVQDIPVIETYRNDGKPKPIIIVQHGFKNRKESTIGLAIQLAEKGFFVVSPDAYAHGERKEDPLSLVEIIVKTSKEYDVLLDHYAEDHRVNVNKLGITGFSMGGCITFHYAVYGKYHPMAIAPTISTPYFEQLIGSKLSRSIYSSKQGLTVAEDMDTINKIDNFIIINSPFKDYKKLKNVDILMQNGKLDRYVNSDGVKMLNHVLPEINPNVQLIMVPRTKHQVRPVMKDNIVEFMCQNVK